LRHKRFVPHSAHALVETSGVTRAARASFGGSLLLLAFAGCSEPGQQQASLPAPDPAPTRTVAPCSEVGLASWYRGTSKNRAFAQELTAAHPSLPLGSTVRVTAIDTGQSVVVRINDRGPFGRKRIIDLARPAADQLGILHDGVARVRLDPIGLAGGACPFQQAQSG
jgi:rare lipoprotein A